MHPDVALHVSLYVHVSQRNYYLFSKFIPHVLNLRYCYDHDDKTLVVVWFEILCVIKFPSLYIIAVLDSDCLLVV